jgi:nucleoside-diphosphate-sugar epimerase
MPLGALPARFRKPRVLIVGCGDVGRRVAALLLPRARVLALCRNPEHAPRLRERGIAVAAGDLDAAATLARLAAIATHALHLAPPPGASERDARTTALLRALSRRSLPAALVYVSTTGVYGDAQGAPVTETRPLNPQTPRARRRVDAERQVRAIGRRGVRASILRAPGIYAPQRPPTLQERVARALPVLRAQDDVYTAHIHADDLARACVRALWLGRPQRAINACDDTRLKMGDCFDLVADLAALPRPPRITRQQAEEQLPETRLGFLRESRQIDNRRMKRELKLRLRYATVREGVLRQ